MSYVTDSPNDDVGRIARGPEQTGGGVTVGPIYADPVSTAETLMSDTQPIAVPINEEASQMMAMAQSLAAQSAAMYKMYGPRKHISLIRV